MKIRVITVFVSTSHHLRAHMARLLSKYKTRLDIYLHRRKAKSLARSLSHAPPYMLHLGCGLNYFEGWINLDANKELQKCDVVWDLRFGVPFPDNSCRHIYCEHMLEHLPVSDGLNFLRECRRVLEPGGVMRIAMPSLDFLLERVCAGDWKNQDWLTWPDFQFITTRAEMLNIAFRWWDHQWLYDREELHRRLREAGFTAIEDVDHSKSKHCQLENRETRKDSILICEVVKNTFA